MTADRETVPVEQIDREAAADRLHGGRSGISVHELHTIQGIIDGRYDTHPWVQAFARHRINSIATLISNLERNRDHG